MCCYDANTDLVAEAPNARKERKKGGNERLGEGLAAIASSGASAGTAAGTQAPKLTTSQTVS